jgi:hypothetical protein
MPSACESLPRCRDTWIGRIVHRQIWTTAAAGIDFPDAAQVFRIRRDVFDHTGQRVSKEIVHGITSLNLHNATAAAIARWVRQHWGSPLSLRLLARASACSGPTTIGPRASVRHKAPSPGWPRCSPTPRPSKLPLEG